MKTNIIATARESEKELRIDTPPLTSTPPPEELQLSIVKGILDGINPAKTGASLGVAPTTLQYHITALKRKGIISKKGYGTWEVLKPLDQGQKKNYESTYVHTTRHPQLRKELRTIAQQDLSQKTLSQFTPDSIRAHGIRTVWKVPRSMNNWNNIKREEYLLKNKIPFKHLNIGGAGQSVTIEGKIVHLTNKSIIIYDKASYFAPRAINAKVTALAKHLSIIKHLERLLHTDFKIGDDYAFRVSNKHYAMIYNSLAQQYNKDGRKLEVRNGRGLWLWIDDSFGAGELEAGNQPNSEISISVVQDFFNSLDDNPVTVDSLLAMISGLQENQKNTTEQMASWTNNIESHIESVQAMGVGSALMAKQSARMADVLERLEAKL